ncbi:MAG: ATP-binding protein [Elusimicrobia bacterium]|nr:ATP-binding protein [Elusimicrobiota bacterium]
MPEILKAKVQVFAELWRKTARLTESEENLRLQLQRLREEEEARRDSEEKYHELFTRASDAIIVYDRRGAVLDANRAALRLYGYSLAELKNLKAADLADDLSKKSVLRLQRRKDGSEFPSEITHGEFTLKGRRMIMALARDATERKKADEAERLRDREFLQRRLVSIVSHELRTPITAIKGFAETLRLGADEDPKNRLGFIRIIEKHAERLGSLVEDLLAVAELESGKSQPKPAPLALKEFSRDFIGSIAPIAARRAVSITLDIEDDLVLWMDPAHLTQVLQNLLDNAIKYNRKSGSVIVTARRTKGGQAWISVADTGIGIPPADLPLVFEQFHRSADARAQAIKGTGLGLYIIKTIVESNGGRIWAESAKDEGSVFHFTTPLADGARARSRAMAS